MIQICDENTAPLGNDFALDDLSFSLSSSKQAPSVVGSPATSSNPSSDVSQEVWFPQPTPLLRDRAFGFALPDQVRLTYQIEASTDLIHWVQATNVAFYFKDLDSTNSNERFYRFEKK